VTLIRLPKNAFLIKSCQILPLNRTTNNITLSFVGFALKAICALALSWMAANNLPVDEFAIWAIFFSISMVLSSGDLGVGQYILTYMASSDDDSSAFAMHFFNGLSSLIVLSAPVFVLGLIIAKSRGFEIAFAFPLCILVASRIPLIAYGAFMQVQNRIHEKRLIDSAPYCLAIPIMYIMYSYDVGVYSQLLVINLLLTLGGIVTMQRCNVLGVPKFQWAGLAMLKSTLKKSLPYLLNNASGIVIYGGFITLFSFYLDNYQIAVLAIYHSVILSLGYQAYDVVFRSFQLRISEAKVFKGLSLFLGFSAFIIMIALNEAGVKILQFLFANYTFEQFDLMLFALFACLEFGYLLATTRLQMSVSGSTILSRCSITKLLTFLVMMVCMVYLDVVTILVLCYCLIAFSGFNLLYLYFSRKLIA
jgi:hypothetical protein